MEDNLPNATSSSPIADESLPPKRPVRLSTKAAQLSFERSTLAAMKKVFKRANSDEDVCGTILLHCLSCEFQTNNSWHLKVHQEHHNKRFEEQCPFCSYSVNQKKDIIFHLEKHHHPGNEVDEAISMFQNDEAAGESYNPPSGSQIKYLICSECDYKAVDRYSLNWHIQKKHSVATEASSSARNPPPSNNDSVVSSKSADWALEQCEHCDFRTRWKGNLRKHLEHHLYMYTIQCERCNYSVDHPSALARHVKYHHDNDNQDGWEQDFSTDNEEEEITVTNKEDDKPSSSNAGREEWHYFPSGIRLRYKYCEECDYKTPYRSSIQIHMNKQHLGNSFQVSSSKDAKTGCLLRCDLCEYETHSKRDFEKHEERHEKKSSHQCYLCSYSVNTENCLAYHLKRHHLEQDELLTDDLMDSHSSLQASGEDDSPDESNVRDRKRVKRHHVNEDLADADKEVDDVETVLKCDSCNFSTDAIDKMTVHEECHTRCNSLKCPLCSFSSNVKNIIWCHVKNDHEVNRELQSENEQKKGKYECELCDFVTENRSHMDGHRKGHTRNQKHACYRCNFSSKFPNVIENHLKHHHRNEESVENYQMEVEFSEDEQFTEMNSVPPRTHPEKKSKKSRKVTQKKRVSCQVPKSTGSSGAKHNRVPIKPAKQPSKYDAEEADCRKQIAQMEEGIRFDRRSLEKYSNKIKNEADVRAKREEKIQSLRAKVELMNDNIEVIEDEVKDVLRYKDEVEQQAKEAMKKKMKAEFELRAQQCKALELGLVALDAVGDDQLEAQEGVNAAEEKVKSLEIELQEIESELRILEEEDEALTEDLEEAEACYVGATRSLSSMQTELEDLESLWKADVDLLERMNQMVDSSKERVQVGHQLEQRLLKIKLLKKRDRANQKKSSLLMLLKKQFDGDGDNPVSSNKKNPPLLAIMPA